jgi:hypothetical protein
MRAALRRAKGLVNRYRTDRRLPPTVRSLYWRALRAQRDEVVASRLANVRPIVGGESDADGVGRLGARRVATAGPLRMSLDQLAVESADEIVGSLTGASLEPFVVDREEGRIVLGLQLGDRQRALRVLVADHGSGWLLRWDDRGSTGLVPLAAARRDRRVRNARSWTLFRPYKVGEWATGDETGVVITFWIHGTSGQLELVGTRGQERFDARSPHTIERIGGHEFPGRSAFPIGSSLERFGGEVDVVYTWVDGSDPDWLDAFRATAESCGRSIDDEALDPARYRSRDELRYSLRSLWMYCGWVRHVWIVTAGQRPDWLVDHPMVSLVDHRDILPAEGLPTFNSHAIEASLHHIDGLAEHVVYFNDDMLVARPLRPETFFHPNGLAKVFQSGARVPVVENPQTQAVDTAAIRGRELLAERFGRVAESKPLHSPYPLLRSVMAEVERDFPEVVGATRRSRFRSPADLSTAASFSQHYALATGRATLGTIATEYVHVESGRLRWHLDAVRLARDVDTCCINETRDGGPDRDRAEADVRHFFESMFPVAAPWESAVR